MENLIVGKRDKIHGKIVKTVAAETDEYYVFVDSKNEIYLYVEGDSYKYPLNFNKLHSRIRRLEILVLSNLEKIEQGNYNYLLANNLGEAMESDSITTSWADLNNIEKDLNLIVNANQKKYFSYGTNIALVITVILILYFHLNKNYYEIIFGKNSFQIILCSLFGGIGSLIFNYSKSKKYNSNRVIGRFNHLLEGGLRIFYGVIYALIVILGIKSGMILNFINNSGSIYILSFIAIVAGASDTFITGILKSLEAKATEEGEKA